MSKNSRIFPDQELANLQKIGYNELVTDTRVSSRLFSTSDLSQYVHDGHQCPCGVQSFEFASVQDDRSEF
jgi:hypothetical protein